MSPFLKLNEREMLKRIQADRHGIMFFFDLLNFPVLLNDETYVALEMDFAFKVLAVNEMNCESRIQNIVKRVQNNVSKYYG